MQDFYGQRLAENIGHGIIVAGFVVGTAAGWATQSLEYALYGWLAGLALAVAVCVPPWPIYRRHPVSWLPVEEEEGEEGDGEKDSDDE